MQKIIELILIFYSENVYYKSMWIFSGSEWLLEFFIRYASLF